MLKISLTFLILLLSCSAFSQSGQPFDNNDPKVNTAEAQWLNEHAATPQFDFNGKTIDFIHVVPALFGIGKDYYPNNKKMLWSSKAGEYLFKVIVLDSSEKNTTNGYDALLIFSREKHQRKFKHSSKAEALVFSRNRYPQIPERAGSDNNNQLSAANAEFFNQVYKHEPYLEHFDFTDKKILLVEVAQYNIPPKFVSIKNYVQQVKNKLYQSAVFNPDQAFILTATQKQQSGGYDVIISTLGSKKGLDLDYLLQFLDQK